MDTGAFLYDGDMKSVLSAPRRTAQSKGTDFVRGTSARKARKDDVFDLLDKNFDRFDRNGDLRVTWPEMRKSVADPLIQGKDAAALATLYSLLPEVAFEMGLKRNPAVTPELLQELRDTRDLALEEGEESEAELYYQKYLGKLEDASTELFPQGLPDGMKVRQGYGPSCAILATTVSQALIDPQVVKDAFSVRADGKVAVKFPGLPKPVTVTPTTDTETALFATAGKNGTWLNHIEKAWGTLQGSDPEAAFEKDSWPAKSIRAWSGGKATTSSVPEQYREGGVPVFAQEMASGLDQDRIVMSWTRNGDRELEGLIPGHAHTVLAVDEKKGSVKVRNPWGHREPLNAKGKPRDGKDDGVFELSFAEYARDFGRFSLQTTASKTKA